MRIILVSMAVASLAACAPTVPDSAAGVGFQDYDRYLAEKQVRDAQLSTGPAQPVTTAPAAPQTEAQATAAAAVAAIQPQGGQTAVAPLPGTNNEAISDEQDFGAVAARQSIESDAQRRAAQSAQYRVVQPTAVPERPSGTTPTPIEFALEVTHPVGQKVYNRPLFSSNKASPNCARYQSAEQAQDAFLKSGGPDRDKLKLDPDGDGYACAWNPAKYRQLVRS